MKGKIACVVHANREATTSCGSCGNRLCSACAVNANGIDYCDACAPATAVRTEFDADYERIPVVNPARAERARFGQRAMAFLIDLMLFVTVAGLIGLVSWAFSGRIGFVISPRSGPGFYVFWVVTLLAAVVYSSVMTSMSGQTLGKQVTGAIVLEPDGHILPLRTCILRSLAAVLSAAPLGLGFLWMLWDKDRQTWHDKIARTSVFQWEEIS